jgi:hypothetical protein
MCFILLEIMEIESLAVLTSRRIAGLLLAASPRTSWWENMTSTSEIIDTICTGNEFLRFALFCDNFSAQRHFLIRPWSELPDEGQSDARS